MSDPSATSSAPSLAVKIDSEKGHPLAWKTVVKRAAVVLVAGVTIYPAWLRYGGRRSTPQTAVAGT